MISLKRVQYSIQTLIGQVISEATILKYMLVLHQALQQWEKTAIEQLLILPAIHLDETSLRVEKKNHWIQIFSGDLQFPNIRTPALETFLRPFRSTAPQSRRWSHRARWAVQSSLPILQLQQTGQYRP